MHTHRSISKLIGLIFVLFLHHRLSAVTIPEWKLMLSTILAVGQKTDTVALPLFFPSFRFCASPDRLNNERTTVSSPNGCILSIVTLTCTAEWESDTRILEDLWRLNLGLQKLGVQLQACMSTQRMRTYLLSKVIGLRSTSKRVGEWWGSFARWYRRHSSLSMILSSPGPLCLSRSIFDRS
jgi:hypothetical protein